MNNKVTAILERVANDVRRGDHAKALKRVSDGIEKMPDERSLYEEAVDVSLEAGEPLTAVRFLKEARARLQPHGETLWDFALKRVKSFNDPVLGKYLVDEAVKKRDLSGADTVLTSLEDHTAAELLSRVRNKMRTLATSQGDSADGDLVEHTLADALLCVRAGRFLDATRTLVSLADQRPAERDAIARYFLQLSARHRDAGSFQYGVGCALRATAQLEPALAKMIEAVQLEPELGPEITNRIEGVKATPRAPVDAIDFALAQVSLAGGETRNAVDRLRECVRRNNTLAPRVLGLIEPLLTQGAENPSLDYLYAELCLKAGRTDVAIRHLRKIYRKRERRSELLTWLDARTRECALAPHGLLFYGEIALDQGLYRRAIEIFREFLVSSPNEVQAVETVMSPHKTHPTVEAYAREIGDSFQAEGDRGDFEIVHYGANGFTLEENGTPSEPEAAEPESKQFAFREQIIDLPGPQEGAALPRSEASPPADRTAPQGTDAAGNGGSPAAADTTSGLPWQREPSVERRRVTVTGPAWPGGDPNAELDFDVYYNAIVNGSPERRRRLEAVEKGLALGRIPEVRRLLDFEPETVAQDIDRKYLLSSYYLAIEQPLSALVTLKTVNLNALDRERRREFLLKIAYCYQTMSRFEAAHSTYLRILSENPGLSAVEELARMNYQKFMLEVAGCATTLEKITKL